MASLGDSSFGFRANLLGFESNMVLDFAVPAKPKNMLLKQFRFRSQLSSGLNRSSETLDEIVHDYDDTLK